MSTAKLNKNDCESLRLAIQQALPKIEPTVDSPISIKRTYVPASHFHALEPENVIVVGMRGSGKSFWTAALSSESHRRFIKSAYPDIQAGKSLVSVGFSAKVSDKYPDSSVLGDLSKEAQKDHSLLDIWRAVIAQQIVSENSSFPVKDSWINKYHWVKGHHEELSRMFRDYDEQRKVEKQPHFILFDELDRLASTWEEIRLLAKSLFQLALEFQGYRNIHLKLFVRPDFLEDRDITAFPDGSKLLANKVLLDWRKTDLFALLFQSLANADGSGGELFRKLVQDTIGCTWKSSDNVYLLPSELRKDGDDQKNIFDMLAGPYMSGTAARKKGFPYTWLPNHLMDSKNAVSPRSFCEALRTAAEYEGQISDTWLFPLFYKGIHAGVQQASQIRVNEIGEDYSWVKTVLESCRNRLSVPCKEDDLFSLWKDAQIVKTLKERKNEENEELIPLHLNQNERGLLEDLESLGIISRLGKDRIQMPDVYRVAFGISRKGGVPRLK